MRADWIKVIIAAARFPLRSDPVNSQFQRPSAKCPLSDLIIRAAIINGHCSIFQIARQHRPAFRL